MRIFEFVQRGGSGEADSVTITRNNPLDPKLVWSSSGTTWAVFALCTALLYRFVLRPRIVSVLFRWDRFRLTLSGKITISDSISSSPHLSFFKSRPNLEICYI